MANEHGAGMRVSGGYCHDCKTYFVMLKIGALPTIEKHGMTKDEAFGMWKAVGNLLDGTTNPDAPLRERITEALDMLGVERSPLGKRLIKGTPPPMGKPRFG
jgi:hypothetical protein